jgi:hypothetical protein
VHWQPSVSGGRSRATEGSRGTATPR